MVDDDISPTNVIGFEGVQLLKPTRYNKKSSHDNRNVDCRTIMYGALNFSRLKHYVTVGAIWSLLRSLGFRNQSYLTLRQ